MRPVLFLCVYFLYALRGKVTLAEAVWKKDLEAVIEDPRILYDKSRFKIVFFVKYLII